MRTPTTVSQPLRSNVLKFFAYLFEQFQWIQSSRLWAKVLATFLHLETGQIAIFKVAPSLLVNRVTENVGF